MALFLAVVAASSGQNRPDAGGWHGAHWGMAEADVRGLYQDKLRLCSGWPPPLSPPQILVLTGVDCFVLDNQQIGSHRYAVAFLFFKSSAGELEEALKTAEEYQRQWAEFQKLPGVEPAEKPNRPAIVKPGKKLALIEFFAQDVDDQIGVFRDLHNDLVNSYGQPIDKTDESDDVRVVSRERWLRRDTEIRLDLSLSRNWPANGSYRWAFLAYRVRPSVHF